MIEINEYDDFEAAFEGLDALIAETEASPEYAEETLVGDAQSLIVAAMEGLKINRAQLADRMGVSKARVSQMLSPACTNLTLRLLGRAGHALDVPLKLVRADEVVARKGACGTWNIGKPWGDGDWMANSLAVPERVANDTKETVDLNRAVGVVRRALLAAA